MKSTSRRRRYDNSLRQEHAERTRNLILDAVHTRISKGDREIVYARLAQEAKVSVPTVYRHFPTVDDIFRAYASREAARFSDVKLDRVAIRGYVREFFRRFDDPTDLLTKVPRLSQMWQFSRVGTVPRRRAGFAELLTEIAPHLTATQQAQFVDACTVTLSSAMGEALAGYLALDSESMADRVELMLTALLDHAERLSKKNQKGTDR